MPKIKTIAGVLPIVILIAALYCYILDKALTFNVPENTNEGHYGGPNTNTKNNADSLPHHMLLIDESVHERIKKTNSSHYTWLGNQWMPPLGVPIFTPQQLKAYYSQRNVLVIGDSTSRRFHATFYSILNGTDLDDIKLKDIDLDHFELEHACNVDAGGNADIGDRYLAKPSKVDLSTHPWYSVCLNNTIEVEDANDLNNTIEVKDANESGKKVEKHSNFDHIWQVCYHTISWFWRDNDEGSDLNEDLTGFAKDYDLVIVAQGVWEMTRPKCNRESPGSNTTLERLQIMLDTLEKNSPDDLQVVIRTGGWDSNRFGRDGTVRNCNALAHKFFHDLDQRYDMGRYQKNLTLVDWGGPLEKRSYNEDRIEGDSSAHYGVEARLLLIQQLTHELVKAELIAMDMQKKKHGSLSTMRSTKRPSVLE